jgi:nicotinic acid mononucleotide adenylyltransferase
MEKKNNVAYFTFGRFQPPTIGHGLLINSVANAAKEGSGDAYIFLSSTVNKLNKPPPKTGVESKEGFKNPLDVYYKIKVLKKMYPSGVQFVNTRENKCNSPFLAVERLASMGYTHVYFLVGGDRAPEFGQKFKKSDFVTVVSVGARNENNDSVSTGNTIKAMSGTKMRRAAAARNSTTFKKGVITNTFTNTNADELLEKVRSGMGLTTGGRYTRRSRRLRG